MAWIQYTHDNDDRLLYASHHLWKPETAKFAWVGGWLDYKPDNPSNWDVERDIKKSLLWPYYGESAGIWKCPGDKSTVTPSSGPFAGRRVPRVRSMSMNAWMGGLGGVLDGGTPGTKSPPWRIFSKLGDLIDPGSANTLLLWDQSEDSINLGNFIIDMTGFPDKPEQTRFDWDLPASYHNGAGGLSFADGHAEIRRWRDSRTTPPIQPGKTGDRFAGPSPHNPDIIWLQHRATRKLN